MSWADFFLRLANPGAGKSTANSPERELEVQEDSLFLAHRARTIGQITSAEIARNKSSGRRYIRLNVQFGDTDTVMCTMGRILYTHYVVTHDLPTDLASEEANVALLVGEFVRVRWEHIKKIDGVIYVSAVALSVGDKP